MKIVKSNRVIIKYRAADQVSRTNNSLAGCYSYYAKGQDALDSGMFCEKLILPYWGDERITDFVGKQFVIKNRDELTPDEQYIAAGCSRP
ncbi:hypothetical protein [Photorhabdus luminescens]|uniref:Uncharacterized protein n=1 Tax=Photorhabdus luminescens subsp. mexicana TaxID=2100167 RepID=A0A4R4J4C1_PHOLU|nr:hypothetical protein [Photorhabdus luminescens]TDB48052.1 hypothetical protein C5468_16745 [Photorhabdus luminescens subsp. mexicana]